MTNRTLLTRAFFLLTAALTLVSSPDAEAAKRKTTRKQQQQLKTTEVKVEEVGILRDQDIHVVQKLQFTKTGKKEVGFDLNGLFFDAYTIGVQGGFNLNVHQTERTAFHLEVVGGYGFGNLHHAELTNDVFDLSPSLGTDARRILAGVSAGIMYSPIYAKFSLGGKKVFHNDVYGILGASGFLGQGLEPGIGFKPLIGPMFGIGTRIYSGKETTLRFELKDHITFEKRSFTGQVAPVNNVVFTIGISALKGGK